ncbi:heme/hemin ABC transporter substrate-binding protein [Saccharospirillum impatiens]|uniref:heme/hemin ABC transporter substrate-binding protein n=1 Tax=Saccharospirillum impatiens TaxID=169438 RepID=UPI00041932AE|nr:ABC transporter substrate-binding protein [Saccharospirillum impatiens]
MTSLKWKARLVIAALAATMSFASQATADRLVSIDGSLTEIIYALGGEADLVGVDTTSIYPPAATELPDVGYMRALSAEGILSLAPDRVITTADAGPADALSQLQAAGIDIDILDNTPSLAGLVAKIQSTATAVGRSEAGNQLAVQVEADVEQAQRAIAEQLGPLNVMFVMDGGSRGFQVAGRDTLADGVLDVAGFTNVFADIQGYKPLTPEAAINANPDVILVFHSQKSLDELAANPALSLTQAVQNGQLYNVDDLDLLSFGPRLGIALQGLLERMTDRS